MLDQPYILHLHVKNFKSIKDIELDVPKFAVFVGPNGAGKTNLIQALSLLGDIIDRGNSDPIRDIGWSELIRREKRPARSGLCLGAKIWAPQAYMTTLRRSRPQPLASETGGFTVECEIFFSGKKDSEQVEIAKESLTLRRKNGDEILHMLASGEDAPIIQVKNEALLRSMFMPDEKEAPTQILRALYGHQSFARFEGRRFLRVLTSRYGLPWTSALNNALSVQRYRLDSTSLRADSSTELKGRTSLDGTGRGLASAVARLRGFDSEPKPPFALVLNTLQAVYSRIEDVLPVRISSGRLTLQFKERGILEPLDQGSVSDGVLHALALLIALSERRSGLLAIEEPENAIHPWSTRAILDYAQRADRQAFITTHSETVVNSIKDAESLFIVEQGDNGTVIESAVTREEALNSILQQSGQKLGDVWLDGSLGGVPESAKKDQIS